jgi:DNA-binding PadR family transcriptional regulator
MPSPKITLATQVVLLLLLSNAKKEWYGIEVTQVTGIPSGTLQPILSRLCTAGWVTDRWESINEYSTGRPPRHYYQIRPGASQEIRRALDAAPCSLPRLFRALGTSITKE